ncbi:hypothetical protein PRZ48_008267 [Zasmidium cellare]|uniref:Uncharacterized protein n=1 Tax=Zasmidium cellare TaxID=395010 RepID=A0ABR0EFN7_ZASCE|nr:hypothetical protein PRZ48_008267 [Zasmidium cellare]
MSDDLQTAYRLYQEQSLEQFVDLAVDLIETGIPQHHRIRLLILLGTAVASPSDTHDYYDIASRELRHADAFRSNDDPEEELVLQELHGNLAELHQALADPQKIVLDEAAARFPVEAGDADDMGTVARPGSIPQLDGPADEPIATGEEPTEQKKLREDLELRPKVAPSQAEGDAAKKPAKQRYQGESKVATGKIKQRTGTGRLGPRTSKEDLRRRFGKDDEDERSLNIG